MPPKIKIIDVVDKEVGHDDYTITNNEVEESKLPIENTTSETTEETTAIIEEKDQGTTEQTNTDTATTEPTKKIRNQELVKCEKCGKFVTAKTLKYTHSLKCGVEKYQPGRPKKSEIKINENENIQEAPPPPPPAPPPEPTPAPVQKVKEVRKPPVQRIQPPKTVVKEVVKTFEEMRKERLTERLKQRAERNVNLFKQVL